MKQYACRAFEEALPLFAFLRNKRKIMIDVSDEALVAEKSAPYAALDEGCLKDRIEEEHERATKIDEKTSKFTLGLSVSLTVLAAASGAFAKFVPANPYAGLVSIACGFASIYMLLAGVTALGALKTLAVYGYGTQHALRQKNGGVSYLSQALYAQERMNVVRHLRNEAAYQSLRNGFLVLLVALIGSLVGLIIQETDSNIISNNAALEKADNSKAAISGVSADIDDNKSMQPTADASAD
ncbi:hypothetical protein SAMN05216571_104290 [Onishia taeanensis]|uniref:Uncharacterized protein n=1 Tax=Onishia taeanensis TaxID=284577 RepID=A0A1G7RK99_9GAMM|nr:hypothetical protein [Halomonas taeanensis]SDG10659.1 hypothetical protein SAMN05216571_104290 [Halomonas taeanensis]